MRRRLLASTIALVSVAAATAPAVASTAVAHRSNISAVRAATAPFHRLSVAEAQGYKDLGLCIDHMGEHWVDTDSVDGDEVPDVFQDGVLDPLHPEALVYAHERGRLRLVAVEWVSVAPGTVPGLGELHLNSTLGVHVLHAWIWKHNPDGMFSDMNPRISNCPT